MGAGAAAGGEINSAELIDELKNWLGMSTSVGVGVGEIAFV